MTVRTRTLKITDWTQVSDGTETVSLQILSSGEVTIVDADTMPAADVRGRIYSAGKDILITPPTVAWIRSVGEEPAVIVI